MRNERDTKSTVRSDKTPSLAKTLFLATLVGIGLLAVFFIGLNRPFMDSKENVSINDQRIGLQGTRLYDPSVKRLDEVHYQGTELALSGPAVAMADGRMAEIGLTDEGLLIYQDTQAPGERNPNWPVGGGGGEGTEDIGPPGVPQAEYPVYLKTVDGKFINLVQMKGRGADAR